MCKFDAAKRWAMLVLVAAGLAAGAADGTTITISTSLNQLVAGADNQGWWSSNVTFRNDPVNDNYHTGAGDTFRSFFSFDLSGVSGVVTAAEFDVRRYDQSGPVSLNLWDVTTFASTLITKNPPNASIFADLGSGVSYGVFSVATGASTDVLQFTLNAAALADINSQLGSGYFSIGASISGGGDIFSSSNEEPGGSSCHPVDTHLVCPGGGPLNSTQNLVLQVTPAAVPEPPSLLLFGIGLAGLSFSRRKQA